MKTLFLSGYGIDLHIDNGRLVVTDGRDYSKEPITQEFKAKHDELDLIIIYGHTGNISLEAMKWLSKQNIVLTFLNWDGRVLMNVLGPDNRRFNIRMAQYDAYRNEKRVPLAKAFIEAKIEHTILVMDWIKTRYPHICDEKVSLIEEIRSYKSHLEETIQLLEHWRGKSLLRRVSFLRTIINVRLLSKSEQGWNPKRPYRVRTIPRLKDVTKGMGSGKNAFHRTSLARNNSYDRLSNCSEGRIGIRVEEEDLSPFAMGNQSYSACS